MLRLFLIVVSLSMCFFSRTNSSFFLYLNSASNLVTIITGITQCKGIRIPESGKFVFVESGSRKTLLVESTILGYGVRYHLNESGIPLNPESKFHWQTLECSTWNVESTIQDCAGFLYMGRQVETQQWYKGWGIVWNTFSVSSCWVARFATIQCLILTSLWRSSFSVNWLPLICGRTDAYFRLKLAQAQSISPGYFCFLFQAFLKLL